MADRDEEVEFAREVLAFFKDHAEELRAKGLPVDDMIRDLKQKLEVVLAAAKKVRDLNAEDELLTKKREHLRKTIDELATGLPPDLVDGMGTVAYMKGAVERQAERRRRGRRGLGG